jgi:hypothetical protein
MNLTEPIMAESAQQKLDRSLNGAARTAGVLLIAATTLEVAVMAHHPSIKTANLALAIEKLRTMVALSAWVHGTLIALLLVGYYGFTQFAFRRGLSRPLVLVGLIAYAAGMFALIAAALIDGFVTPRVVLPTTVLGLGDMHVTGQILVLCSLLNRATADFGAVAMSVGIAVWSIDLLRDAGFRRATGVLGVLVGLVPAIALVFGALALDVHGMLLVVILQAIWALAVGTLLVTRRV